MREALIGIVSALVGFATGLITPWVKWWVEKKQQQHLSRREQIRVWREVVESTNFHNESELNSFKGTAAYASLRANVTGGSFSKVEQSRTIYVGGGRGPDVLKQGLLDEIAELEKQWGLL